MEVQNEEMHPDRYGGDSIYEAKKVMEAWSTPSEYRGWIKNTLIKYLSRYGKKDDYLKEAKKILNYAQFLVDFEEKQVNKLEPKMVLLEQSEKGVK